MRRARDSEQAAALGEAESIALFFPDVRPAAGEAETAIAAIEDGTSFRLAAEHLARTERRRLVDSWASRHRERWALLVAAARSVELAEQALVVGALRAVIGERKPCDPEGLAEIEAAGRVHPGNALAAVIQPQTVWDYAAAVAAADDAALGDRDRAIAAIGFARFASCERKLHERVEWVRRQLPFRDFPRATALLAEGCELAENQPGFDAELGCAVLEGYVRLLALGFPNGYITSVN